MELPKGAGHAIRSRRRMFRKVGSCRPGSVLGSILGAFWEAKSPLYSFLVGLGCKLDAKKHV